MTRLSDMHIIFKLCFFFQPLWCCEIQGQKKITWSAANKKKRQPGLLPTTMQFKKLSETGTYKILFVINGSPF